MSDLRLSIDVQDVQKALTATTRFENQIKKLATGFNSGQVSTSAYNRGLLQIKRSYETLGVSSQKATYEVRRLAAAHLASLNSVEQATTANQRLAASQNQVAAASQRSARGLNRSGVLMQQTGYQVGDFIVQVQSGTNWMVAFGQQATQVAGTLTLLGGRMVAIGSALGIMIPLLTAVGAYFVRTSGSGKTLTETLQEMLEAIGGVEDSLEGLSSGLSRLVSLGGEYQRIARDISTARAELDFRDLADNFSVSEVLQDEIRGLEAVLNAIDDFRVAANDNSNPNQFVAQAEIDRLVEQLDMSEESARGLLDIFQQLENAEGIQQQVALAEDLVRSFEALTGGVENMDAQQREVYRQYLLTLEAATRLQSIEEGRRQAIEETERGLQQEIQLQQAILQHGEDSLRVMQLRQSFEREALILQAQRNGATDDEIEGLLRLNATLQLAQQEAFILDQALSQVTGLDTSGTVNAINAITTALVVATNAAVALANSLPGAVAAGAMGQGMAGLVTGMGGGPFNSIPMPDLPTGGSGGGGGGGGGGRSLSDIIAEREQQIEQELELIRLSEEQRNLREIELDLLNQYNGAVTASVQAEVSAAAQRIAAREEELSQLERLRDAQEDLADSISNSVGTALTSMVDGTATVEEAFRKMAQNIISELYQVLVVEQLVNQVRNQLTGGGSGGFLGRILTHFPGFHTGGNATRPFIAGERGPELIIPNGNARVVNSNLTSQMMGGGAQDVTVRVFVDDNGNFDAKVEQISQRSVQQAAPSIVNQSVSATVNRVKRGGSTKDAFR